MTVTAHECALTLSLYHKDKIYKAQCVERIHSVCAVTMVTVHDSSPSIHGVHMLGPSHVRDHVNR